MIFLDRDGAEIGKIFGRDKGNWHTFKVPAGENLIGFKANHGDFVRGISFMTMKVEA